MSVFQTTGIRHPDSTTNDLFISSTGNIGIGTDGPSANLHISSTNAGSALRLSHTDVAYYYAFGRDSNDNLRISDSTNGEIIRIQPGGNVGIGTTSPDGRLHVHSGSAGSVTANANADNLIVENSGAGGISILSPNSTAGGLFFGSPGDNIGAALRWNYDNCLLYTSPSPRD